MNRGAFELSASMLVILILSVVIFGGGLYMVGRFFWVSDDIERGVLEQNRREFENRLIQSGEPVSIPLNKAKILIGESKPFALGIINTYQDTDTFVVEMSFSNAFDTNNPAQAIPESNKGFINQRWMFSDLPPIDNLKRNAVEIIPLTVLVGSEMSPGIPTKHGVTYVFNVCVYTMSITPPTSLCTIGADLGPIPLDKIRNELHGAKISKIYVEVP
ncbi:MAG TPA: hypothetical protein VJH22_02840 [Candidatus Nanoarchaeia archaeon]|nr:hypothetical protein [Candidatus Nanoarchaeia archaeon]